MTLTSAMKKLTGAATAATLMLLFIGLPAAPAAGERAKTVIYFDSEGDVGYGWLESPRAKCIKNRKIVFFHSKRSYGANFPEDFTRIGTTRSDGEGNFQITFSKYREGRFVAKARKTEDCNADRHGSIWDDL